MRIVGLDLSLSSTGVAGITDGKPWCDRIRTGPDARHAGLLRMRVIRERVLSFVLPGPDLVLVEGLAVGSQTGQHLTRAGMWHLVMDAIDARGIPWVPIPPATLKKYATGKGNAGKDEVLAAVIRRFPTAEVRGNDEADALMLAAMGADHLGQPLVDMPEAHRAALAKVPWPDGDA